MTESILRLHEIKRRTALSRSAMYAAMARGDFPRQIQLSVRAVGWLESEINAWIAARPKKAFSKVTPS